MSAWSTVAIAVCPAAITGLTGYFQGRLQRESLARAAKAETDRLRLAHAEEERRHRQGSYHDLLVLLARLEAMAYDATSTQETYRDWLGSWQALAIGVSIFGTREVDEAIQRVGAALNRISARAGELAKASPNLDGIAAYQAAYAELATTVAVANIDLKNAMRLDVGPDGHI